MKIIAATDGTPYSHAALDALSSILWPAGTEIRLLTVFKHGESPYASVASSRYGAADPLDQIVDDLRSRMPTCEISAESVEGDPTTQIAEYARRWLANLIIMGTRGNKGLDLMLKGSVSQGVLTKSPCPVFIIKSDFEENSDMHFKFNRVLVATDNSPYCNAAFNWLKSLKWPPETKFRLVTVTQSLTETMIDRGTIGMAERVADDHENMKDLAEKQLNILKTRLEASLISKKTGTETRKLLHDAEKKSEAPAKVSIQVGEGDPKSTILQIASSWDADLIVMGSHGRTGLSKILLGSVSQSVAVHSQCSVAIIRGIVAPGAQFGNKETGRFNVPDNPPDDKRMDPRNWNR